MFDLGIRSYDENAVGEATRVRFRCGCMMRPAGVGLVLRSCCRDHVPNETGEKVVLGALEGGPWLVEIAQRMNLFEAEWGADGRLRPTLAEAVELAVDLEKQRRLRELNEAAEAARQADGPNPFGGERDTPGSWLPNLPRPNELVPREKSETQTIRYQFEALHRRIRAAAWRFFDNFQA